MSGRPALGLYFTDNFIEISRVNRNGTGLDLYEQELLPPDCVVNGEIKDKNLFRQTLVRLLEKDKSHPITAGQNTVIGVNDNQVFLREFVLPKISGKEIEEAIEYQIRNLQPLLPSGVETDWQIIGHNQEGQIEVLLAAIPKSIIQSYLASISEIGLSVVALEPAVFANLRVISQEQLKNHDQLFVFLGDKFGEFTFITNANPRFSDFIQSSEIAKKGGLINTIRDYVVFSNSKHPTRPITEIIISGFSTETENLVSSLKQQNVAANLAVSRLSTTTVRDHNLLHTSHGLSLKTFDAVAPFNLLPLAYRLVMTRGKMINRWKVVLDILIFLTILVCGLLVYIYRQTQTQVANIQTLGSVYRQQLQLPNSQTLITEGSDLNTLSGKLINLRDSTGGENGILREISAVTPSGISLTSLVYARGPGSRRLADSQSTWSITGVASSRQLVLTFYDRLLNQPDFQTGRLFFGSLEKETSVNFRIASQNQPK